MSWKLQFDDMLRTLGSEAVVIRFYGTDQERRLPMQALPNVEKRGQRKQWSFQGDADVNAGDSVLLVAAPHDLWFVDQVETEVVQNELVSKNAFVSKRAAAQAPKPVKLPAPPLSLQSMHPKVIDVASKYMTDGHHRAAVHDTFIALDNYVQNASGSTDNGASLMQRTFSPAKPVLRISANDEEQTGYMMLFTGAIKAIRNQYSHKQAVEPTKEEALEWLAFASALLRLVDGTAGK